MSASMGEYAYCLVDDDGTRRYGWSAELQPVVRVPVVSDTETFVDVLGRVVPAFGERRYYITDEHDESGIPIYR